MEITESWGKRGRGGEGRRETKEGRGGKTHYVPLFIKKHLTETFLSSPEILHTLHVHARREGGRRKKGREGTKRERMSERKRRKGRRDRRERIQENEQQGEDKAGTKVRQEEGERKKMCGKRYEER